MNILSFSCLATAVLYRCYAFSPHWSSPSRLRKTCLLLDYSNSSNKLIRAVEDLSKEEVNEDIIAIMEETENALSSFLQEARSSTTGTTPRPPTLPPPITALGIFVDDNIEGELPLVQAEKRLQKLRQRLQKETEYLRMAEEALKMQSFDEENVLQRAETVLQQSREAAERRKAEALRRASAIAISTENIVPHGKETEGIAAVTVTEQVKQTRTMRSTVSISGMTNERKERATQEERGDKSQLTNLKAAGVPVLFNWHQDSNGSITGSVKGSEIFMDGDTVSTSPVPFGVLDGAIVTTTSGSRYFLQRKETSVQPGQSSAKTGSNTNSAAADGILSKSNSVYTTAPEGVPSIRNWGLLECGGISGLLFGSPTADDGDYIETTPVSDGSLENNSVVTTNSGSRYFLCPNKASAKNASKRGHEMVTTRFQRGGTVTINREAGEKKTKKAQQQKTPRPTFSLSGFGFKFGASKKSRTKQVPGGTPSLTGWTINNDGTATGVISGSRSIKDGNLVTTSPIVGGRKKRFETVRTATGSVYFLG